MQNIYSHTDKKKGEHYAHEEIHKKVNATSVSLGALHVVSLYNFTPPKRLPNLRQPSGIFFGIKLLLNDLDSLLIKLTT